MSDQSDQQPEIQAEYQEYIEEEIQIDSTIAQHLTNSEEQKFSQQEQQVGQNLSQVLQTLQNQAKDFDERLTNLEGSVDTRLQNVEDKIDRWLADLDNFVKNQLPEIICQKLAQQQPLPNLQNQAMLISPIQASSPPTTSSWQVNYRDSTPRAYHQNLLGQSLQFSASENISFSQERPTVWVHQFIPKNKLIKLKDSIPKQRGFFEYGEETQHLNTLQQQREIHRHVVLEQFEEEKDEGYDQEGSDTVEQEYYQEQFDTEAQQENQEQLEVKKMFENEQHQKAQQKQLLQQQLNEVGQAKPKKQLYEEEKQMLGKQPDVGENKQFQETFTPGKR